MEPENTTTPATQASTAPHSRFTFARLLLGFIGLCLLLWSIKTIHHALQPKYQGKTAQEWFAEIDPYDHSSSASDDMLLHPDNPAIKAFEHFGPDAARFLWREYHQKDSAPKAWFIRKVRLWSRNRWIIDSGEGRNFKARMALNAMGTNAACLLSEVLLRAQSKKEREAMDGLRLLSQIGTRLDVTVPLLISNLNSSNLVSTTLDSLMTIGKPASNALPAVARTFEASTGYDRLKAAATMTALGDKSRIGLLEAEIQDTNSPHRTLTLFLVGHLKSNAVSVLPTLLVIAQDPAETGRTRRLTAQVIEAISPDTAKAAGLNP